MYNLMTSQVFFFKVRIAQDLEVPPLARRDLVADKDAVRGPLDADRFR